MDKEELVKDVEEIKKELDDYEKKKKSPLWYILGVFLALIIVLMTIPHYAVRLDPEPSEIPSINEVVRMTEINESPRDFISLDMVSGSDPLVKETADRIASISCGSGQRVCQAKAMFYFVRGKFDYVSDPNAVEYVKTAKESLYVHSGDCDDASVLLANLLDAIGISVRFVFIPGHVYVQANIPEALNKYRDDGNWVNMDATCSYCEFGEIPWSTVGKDTRILG